MSAATRKRTARTRPAASAIDDDLHRDVRGSTLAHPGEHARELVRFGRRMGGIDDPVSVPVTDRSDDAAKGAPERGVNRGPNEVGRRRLSVRARDPDHFEREGRVPVDRGGGVREPIGDIVDDERRGEGSGGGSGSGVRSGLSSAALGRPLHEESDRSAPDRGFGELHPVRVRPPASDEQIARLDRARVVADTGHPDPLVPDDLHIARNLARELGERQPFRPGHDAGSNRSRTLVPFAADTPAEGACRTSRPLPSI